jgi:hypothetical protein
MDGSQSTQGHHHLWLWVCNGSTAFTAALQKNSDRTMKRDFGKSGKRDDTWVDYRNKNVTWENIHESKDGSSPSLLFEDYYKKQAICPDGEWNDFMDVLQTPLPIAFRINGSGQFAAELRRRFESDFFSKFTSSMLHLDGSCPW